MTVFEAEYCPQCGRSLDTELLDGEPRPHCVDCDRHVIQLPVACVDVVVVKGKQVLLGKRSEDPFSGKWCPPGGIVEPGESPAETASRELAEEMSLTVDIPDLTTCDVYSTSHPFGYHNVGLLYAAEFGAVDGTPEPRAEMERVAFWSVSDVERSGEAFRSDPSAVAQMEAGLESVHAGDRV